MKIKKRNLLLGIVLICTVTISMLLYRVLTFRHHPPSRATQRRAIVIFQNGNDEEVLQQLRLLTLFQPASDLRDAIESLTRHENPDIRLVALSLIADYRDPQAGILLMQHLDDSDPQVAEEAARGLDTVNNALGLPLDQQSATP